MYTRDTSIDRIHPRHYIAFAMLDVQRPFGGAGFREINVLMVYDNVIAITVPASRRVTQHARASDKWVTIARPLSFSISLAWRMPN